jgi:transposase
MLQQQPRSKFDRDFRYARSDCEAVTYAFLPWDRIERCFSDGRFEIDHGATERALRRVYVGRKNYLFAGSNQGAERLAVASTVLAS